MPAETNSPQTQTWVAILTAITGAIAVIAKKRFTRTKGPSTINHQLSTAVDSLSAKLDANHKEVLSTIAAQSTAIEKRLDALESAVARLDERTRK